MTGRIVGRDAELAVLSRAVDASAAGAARVVALGGQPGIGKTRLLAELAVLARERGAAVLDGRAAEWEDALPYGLWVDALDAPLGALGAAASARIDGARADLATIFPAAAEPAPAPALAAGVERHRAHRAVRALLEELARDGPLVLCLDDVQWADAASVDLLVALLDRPPRGPIAIAWAARTGGLPPRLQAALVRAERERVAEGLGVGPLDRAAAGALLGPGVDAATADALFQRSAGNPFYLEELARARDDVPFAVAAALNRELAAVAPAARLVLEAAAVAGEPFEPDLVAAVAERTEADVLAALDELVALGLVRATDVPRRFCFRQPLVRHAVYEAAGAGWRIGAHARAAVALRDRGASPSARARHLEHSARHGDPAAIALFDEAGRDTAGRAPETAARWYEAALRLLPGGAAHDERRLDLLDRRARALAGAGRLADSRAALLDAIEVAGRAAPERRVALEVACARVEQWAGRTRDARRRLHATRVRLERSGSPEAGHLALLLAVDGLHELDFPRTRAYGAEALAAAGEAGDGALGAEALAVLAAGEAADGRLRPARAHADQAAVLLDTLDDAALGPHVEAFHFLAWAETMLERFDAALAHARRGLALSRAAGACRAVVPLLLGRVEPYLGRGELAAARDAAREAVEAGRLTGRAQELSWALWMRAYAEIHSGDVQLAVRVAEEAVAVGSGLEANVLAGADPGWTLGEALVEAGEARRGHSVLLESVGGAGAERVAPGRPPARVGAPDDGRDRARRCRRRARLRRPRPRRRGEARRPRRAVRRSGARACRRARRRRRRARGGRAARSGARRPAPRAAALEAPRLRLALGCALAAAGERSAAVAALTEAEAELAALGAEHWRAQAARELRRLGRRAPGAPARRKRRGRRRGPDRPRARGRPAGARPPHEQGDRAAAVPQREDRRGAPAQHLREAPRVLARGRRPRARAPGQGGRRRSGDARLSPGGVGATTQPDGVRRAVHCALAIAQRPTDRVNVPVARSGEMKKPCRRTPPAATLNAPCPAAAVPRGSATATSSSIAWPSAHGRWLCTCTRVSRWSRGSTAKRRANAAALPAAAAPGAACGGRRPVAANSPPRGAARRSGAARARTTSDASAAAAKPATIGPTAFRGPRECTPCRVPGARARAIGGGPSDTP
jgi:hypothetical protein